VGAVDVTPVGPRTGYGAGVASPAWYEHVFEHPGPDSVARWFVDAGRLLRSRRMGASPDHLMRAPVWPTRSPPCATVPAPGLDEVVDAATRCWVKAAAAMALVRDELVVGRTLGRCPTTRRWCPWPATSPPSSDGSG
jgi:hypothetical protein